MKIQFCCRSLQQGRINHRSLPLIRSFRIMATNAASHNPSMASHFASELWSLIQSAAEATGSPSGPPPPVDKSLNAAVQESVKQDSTGQNVAGKDQVGNDAGQTVMGEAGKEKTAKESM